MDGRMFQNRTVKRIGRKFWKDFFKGILSLIPFPIYYTKQLYKKIPQLTILISQNGGIKISHFIYPEKPLTKNPFQASKIGLYIIV